MRLSRLCHRHAFTLIELLLVVGIIGTLASVVIIAVNPNKQLGAAKDAERVSAAKEIRNALYQYLIDNGAFPNNSQISTNPSSPTPICKQAVTTDSSCVNIDALVPKYITQIPRDTGESNANYAGYTVAINNGTPAVTAKNLSAVSLITNGLVGYWKFAESSGTVAADSSGNGYTGTITNMEAGDWSTDVPTLQITSGGSRNFNDSNDMILFPTEIPLGSAWTISVWIKTPLPVTGTYHTLTRGSSIDHQIIVDPSGNLGVYMNADGGFCTSSFNMASLTSGWHHLAVVGQSGTTKFYMDSSLIGTSTKQSTASIYAMGNYQGGGQVWGQLADFRVYNRALMLTEIGKIAAGNG